MMLECMGILFTAVYGIQKSQEFLIRSQLNFGLPRIHLIGVLNLKFFNSLSRLSLSRLLLCWTTQSNSYKSLNKFVETEYNQNLFARSHQICLSIFNKPIWFSQRMWSANIWTESHSFEVDIVIRTIGSLSCIDLIAEYNWSEQRPNDNNLRHDVKYCSSSRSL